MTKLEYYRLEQGLNREELGIKSGTSGMTVKRIENGDVAPENIRVGTLLRLAAALDVDMKELIDYDSIDLSKVEI